MDEQVVPLAGLYLIRNALLLGRELGCLLCRETVASASVSDFEVHDSRLQVFECDLVEVNIGVE